MAKIIISSERGLGDQDDHGSFGIGFLLVGDKEMMMIWFGFGFGFEKDFGWEGRFVSEISWGVVWDEGF